MATPHERIARDKIEDEVGQMEAYGGLIPSLVDPNKVDLDPKLRESIAAHLQRPAARLQNARFTLKVAEAQRWQARRKKLFYRAVDWVSENKLVAASTLFAGVAVINAACGLIYQSAGK